MQCFFVLPNHYHLLFGMVNLNALHPEMYSTEWSNGMGGGRIDLMLRKQRKPVKFWFWILVLSDFTSQWELSFGLISKANRWYVSETGNVSSSAQPRLAWNISYTTSHLICVPCVSYIAVANSPTEICVIRYHYRLEPRTNLSWRKPVLPNRCEVAEDSFVLPEDNMQIWIS